MPFYESVPQIQTPDFVGNALAAYSQGQNLGLRNQATQNMNQLGQLSAQSYGMTDPTQQNSLLSAMAAISPEAAQQQQAEFQQLESQQKGLAQQKLQAIAQNAAAIGSMPDGPQKDQAWQQMLAQGKASGVDTTAYQGLPTNLGVKMAMTRVANTQQLLGMAGDTAKPQIVTDRNGQEGWGIPGQPTVTPLVWGGAPGQSQNSTPNAAPNGLPTETQNYVKAVAGRMSGSPMFDAGGNATPQLLDAMESVESNGNPLAVSPKGAKGAFQFMDATAKQYGLDNSFDPVKSRAAAANYLHDLYQQMGGNQLAAVAGYNAGPGAVHSALGTQAQQGFQPGTPVYGSPKNQSEIQKRQEDIGNLQQSGLTMTPEEQQQYLLGGGEALLKYRQAQAPQELNSDQEAMAQAIASYRQKPSQYGSTKPAQQAIMARVMDINPSYSQSRYDAANTFMKSLAESSPTSLGGSLNAAGAALGHLNDMADISQNFPDSLSSVNAVRNWISGTTNTGDAAALKQWETAKQALAGEVSKMIKGGVASEGEVNQLQAQLNPNDPNRNQALATLAKMMTDRVTATEQNRDNLLGPTMAPGTSLLNQQQQTQARRLLSLGNFEAPNFMPPGDRFKTAGQGAPQSVPSAGMASPGGASAPAAAINYLRQNPHLAAQFDAKYGAGSSALALGQ